MFRIQERLKRRNATTKTSSFVGLGQKMVAIITTEDDCIYEVTIMWGSTAQISVINQRHDINEI